MRIKYCILYRVCQVLPTVLWKLRKAAPDGDFDRVASKNPKFQRKYGYLYYGYKPRYWWFFIWDFVSDWLIALQAAFVDESLAFHFVFVHAALSKPPSFAAATGGLVVVCTYMYTCGECTVC